MHKPFNLEEAKAGKLFSLDSEANAKRTAPKTIIGVTKNGHIVWEYAGKEINNIYSHFPNDLWMIPETKEKKFLLINQQGTILVHADSKENRIWAQRYNHKILKEFTVEWEE